MLAKALLAWFAILGLAFLNGGFRELVLLPRLGTPAALILSGAILSACVLVVARFTVPRLGPVSDRQALGLGAFWLALTLIFEFGFGRLVQHKPWSELMAAYTFEHGNVWPVVLGAVLVAPLVAVRSMRRGP